MEEKLIATPNFERKEISSSDLIRLLTNPSPDIIQKVDGEEKIVFNRYDIEDEYIILGESIEVNLPLLFDGCIFKSDNSLWIEGLICNESLTFEGCTFSNGIFFQGGTFKKKVSLKYVHTKHIHLSNGTFDEISISAYDIQKIWVSGAKFEKLHIGEHLVNNNIGKLTIFANQNEVGNIVASDQSFDEIYLSGTNKDKSFDFSKIKCNSVSIVSFKNEGSLNFYGIEPKDLNNTNRYFQIINSTLNNVQFHRAYFSHYKELIIINSFITESIFITCLWSNNIRALYGPGYGTFEKSLEDGRKISSVETFAIKEAYRQLKISMSAHSDRIQENKFYAEELNFYNRTLKWTAPWKNQFWDKIVLHLSKMFSDYGQSFSKPLFWLLLGHLILFWGALLLNGFLPLHISLFNPKASAFKDAFEKYFIYINPLRRLETSLSGYLILVDLSMRIWSSYMIYNLIRASRRFIS